MNESTDPSVTAGQPAGDPVESTVEHYVKLLWWPTVIAGFFQVSALTNTNHALLIASANGALVLLAVVHAWRAKANWRVSAVVAALCGGAATLIVQVAELVMQPVTIYVFKLFTQTISVAVFDAIAAGLLFIVVQTIQAFLRANAAPKGGDDND